MDIQSFFSSASGTSPSDESATLSTSCKDGDVLRPPASKRSKHRESGFDKQWLVDFPWVEPCNSPDGGGIFCKVCRKYSRRPTIVPVGCAVWVDIPCITLTRQSLRNHASSASHKDTLFLESQLCLSNTDEGISGAFSAVQSAEHKAMIGAMKCMYLICKQEIPHTTYLSSLLELAKNFGATYLNDICLSKNAHYTSERFMQEAVCILGGVITCNLFKVKF